MYDIADLIAPSALLVKWGRKDELPCRSTSKLIRVPSSMLTLNSECFPIEG
jgi:hypothetical protein